MNFSPDPFSEGLSFEDHLPCEIDSPVEPPSLAERFRLNDRNFSLLKTHALEDYQRRDIEYELEVKPLLKFWGPSRHDERNV